MDIYWIDDKKQRKGPEPEVVIVTMLETGDLTPETKSWHKGCSGWISLEELPALSSYFRKVDEEEEFGDDDLESRNDGKSSAPEEIGDVKVAILHVPGPFIRFWARFFDLFLYVTIVFCFITWFCKSPEEIVKDARFNLFLWFPWIFLEAALLKYWGKTPGKYLCGIRVNSVDGLDYHRVPALTMGVDNQKVRKRGSLSYLQSFRRSLQVMFFGLGFFIYFLPLVAGCISLYLLKKRGTTLWDRSNGTVESSRQMTLLDWFVYIVSFIALLYIFEIVVTPWMIKMPEFSNGFTEASGILQKMNN